MAADANGFFEFHYTPADFVAAQQLHATPLPRTLLAYALMTLALAGGIAWLDGDDLGGSWEAVAALIGLICVGGVLSFIAVWAVMLPWLARRNFARNPLAKLPCRLAVRPDGLHQHSARGEATMVWRDFSRWRANRKTMLLYLSTGMFLPIPARLAAAGFPLDALRATLAREVGAPR